MPDLDTRDTSALLAAVDRVLRLRSESEVLDAIAAEGAHLAGYGAALLTLALPEGTRIGSYQLTPPERAYFEERRDSVPYDERLANRRRIRDRVFPGTRIAYVPAAVGEGFNVLGSPEGRAPEQTGSGSWHLDDTLYIFAAGTLVPESGLLSLDAPADGLAPDAARLDRLLLTQRFLDLIAPAIEARIYLRGLQASERRYREVVGTMTEIVLRQDRQGRITFANESASRALKMESDDLIGCALADVVFLGDDADVVSAVLGEIRPGVPSVNRTYRMTDGPLAGRWFEWVANGNVYDATPLQDVQWVGRDVTQREETQLALQEALEEVKRLRDQLQYENRYLQDELRDASDQGEMIGSSAAMQALRTTIRRVAVTDATVLILGETGTGKELVVRAIHEHSKRGHRALVKVNCASIAAGLAESELFGHERGAFTGAVARRKGRFEIADGGTLFLDEVGELPLDVQAKLLRVLEEGEFERIGSSVVQACDVRVLAATHRDLAEMVAQGRFREDLLFRLNVFPLDVAPLRERPGDAVELAEHFLRVYALKHARPLLALSESARERIATHDWPGNVRELRNLIERAVIISESSHVEESDLRFPSDALPGDSGETVAAVQRAHIIRVLTQTNWVIEGRKGAARVLGLRPSTLRSRMRKLGVERGSTE